jgi:hypothetical protein
MKYGTGYVNSIPAPDDATWEASTSYFFKSDADMSVLSGWDGPDFTKVLDITCPSEGSSHAMIVMFEWDCSHASNANLTDLMGFIKGYAAKGGSTTTWSLYVWSPLSNVWLNAGYKYAPSDNAYSAWNWTDSGVTRHKFDGVGPFYNGGTSYHPMSADGKIRVCVRIQGSAGEALHFYFQWLGLTLEYLNSNYTRPALATYLSKMTYYENNADYTKSNQAWVIFDHKPHRILGVWLNPKDNGDGTWSPAGDDIASTCWMKEDGKTLMLGWHGKDAAERGWVLVQYEDYTYSTIKGATTLNDTDFSSRLKYSDNFLRRSSLWIKMDKSAPCWEMPLMVNARSAGGDVIAVLTADPNGRIDKGICVDAHNSLHAMIRLKKAAGNGLGILSGPGCDKPMAPSFISNPYGGDTPVEEEPEEPEEPVPTYDYEVTALAGVYTAKDYAGTTLASGSNAATIINAALNALPSGRTEKKTVRLNGIFVLSDTIIMKDYSILETVTGGAITWTTSPGDHMIYAEGASNFEIIGGNWNANNASYNPFYFKNCDNIVVKDLSLHDSTNDGMYFLSCSYITVSGTECYNTGGSFCGLVYSNNGLIENNNFHDGGSGIYCYAEDDGIVQNISNIIIRGNTVARTGTTGIEAPSLRGLEDVGDNLIIENNTIIDCGTDGEHPGIMVGWGGFGEVAIRFATNVTVRNNDVSTTGNFVCGQGIDIKCKSGGKIYGNNIHDAYTVGMLVRGNGNEVYNNTITGGRSNRPGIQIWDGSNTDLHDNTIDVSGTGIYIVYTDGATTGCNNNQIDHNDIRSGYEEWVVVGGPLSSDNIIENNTFRLPGDVVDSGTRTIVRNNTEV